jgi:hypothetical protein
MVKCHLHNGCLKTFVFPRLQGACLLSGSNIATGMSWRNRRTSTGMLNFNIYKQVSRKFEGMVSEIISFERNEMRNIMLN